MRCVIPELINASKVHKNMFKLTIKVRKVIDMH